MDNQTSDRFFSKRVSFIYITKNRKKLFDEKLLELKNIKGQNDEIIVVNGGETEINDSDIDEYIKESDISPGHGFNKGVMISKGRYLHPICDDDIVRKKQFKFIDNRNSKKILVSDAIGELYNFNKYRFVLHDIQ